MCIRDSRSSSLYAWAAVYVPALQPEDAGLRLWLNLGLDLTLVISLFVLGGDFWDKVRALFVHEARAVFPPPAPET